MPTIEDRTDVLDSTSENQTAGVVEHQSSAPPPPRRTVVHAIPPSMGGNPVVALVLLPVLLVAVALLLLRSSDASGTYQAPPMGGTSVSVGGLTVDDAWLDAPHGASSGQDVPLRLTVEDTTNSAGVALTRVSSPEFVGAVMRQHGKVVRAIRVPADGSAVNLEWSGASGITLTGLRHPLVAGSYVPVELHFSDGSSRRLSVVAGPLGGISTQRPA